MDKLNFYTVDLSYVQYLQKSEQEQRGFSRVPNMAYGERYKQKFLCGIVLAVNDVDYYVPVTSYKQQKPDNFLIAADNGQVVSSLRFNYMFPVPKELVAIRTIADEPDRAYRALLAQELRYCIKHQEVIQRLAERTYKRVLLGKDKGLVANSCDFLLLEEKLKSQSSNKRLAQDDCQAGELASLLLGENPTPTDGSVKEIADGFKKHFANFKKDKEVESAMTRLEEERVYAESVGKEKKAIEMARLMLENGELVEKIMRYTGLPRNKIEKLTMLS